MLRSMSGVPDDVDAKLALRRRMRALRRSLPDLDERSDRLWSFVRALPAVTEARVVMVFDSVRGEPITAPFIVWCRLQGKTVVLPEDQPPPEPSRIDVVIVPGTAFTPDGHRLGQGGGWYDRFLPQLRCECLKVGVCFEVQLVAELPIEPHDVRLDLVVTEAGVATDVQSSS
jgi:5-formyltetrahydrofolate cyclo-ligase